MEIQRIYRHFIEDCQQKICTDSRRPIPGSMFFALPGDTYDGNNYAQKAHDLGCRYAIVDDPSLRNEPGMIYVDNVVVTLQELARHHRSQFTIPVFMIAGSNGKTTTKELLAHTLRTQKDVVSTKGNYNNHIGVPLTILALNKHIEIAVIEAGTNHRGELQKLCQIAQPTAGVVTNFGRDHLGEYGGPAGVIEANLELYTYLREHGGHVFVNASDDMLVKYSSDMERTLYGPSTSGIFKVTCIPPIDLHSRYYLSVNWKLGGTITTHLVGSYNVDNIACAIAVASHYGVLKENIVTSISSYVPKNNRSELHVGSRGAIVIKDFYNANRTSMEKAIDNLYDIKGTRELIFVLGDMKELGEFSPEEHKAVVRHALSYNPYKVLLLGEEFSNVDLPNEHISYFTDHDSLVHYLNNMNVDNSIVLLKGSQSMNMQDIFERVRW
jgi:UDP-N-acetylmuramoyl-tripeptide--D-alanyl-D-alanine ligase